MANLRKLRQPGGKPSAMDPPKGCAGRSLFHTKPNCSPQALGECLAGVQEFVELMNKFCGAGTHMASLFQDILEDSAYKESAVLFYQSCEQLQKSLEAESASSLAQFQAKWTRLGSRETTPEDGEESREHIGKDMQLVAESFTDVLQLQCTAFSLGADSMWPFTKLKTPEDMLELKPIAMETGLAQLESDLFNPYLSLAGPQDLGLDMISKDPPKASPESPSKLNKFSNFLSKIGRSGCEAGGSSFYVAMPEPAGVAVDDAASRAGHGGQATMPGSNAAAAMEAGSSLANHMEELHLADKGMLLNGELASQEELDNVIDFLSGCPKSCLSTVPEALPTRSVPCTAPPPHIPYYMPPTEQLLPIGYYGNAMTMSTPAEMYSSAPIPDMTKTHTWPYRVHNKGMPPNLQDPTVTFSQAGYVFNVQDTADRDYTRYLASMTKTKSQQGLVSNGVAPPPWPGGDPNLNKSWPGWFPAETMDSTTRHWSVMGDSSSCSDDSSNGEVPWMMGLDLANQMGHKRRHSSGGENNFSCQGPPIGMTGMPDTRPHSVENLREVQAKSSGTWPSRQPWMKGSQGDKDLGGPPMMTPSQWSQPPPASPAAGPWGNAGLPGALPPKSPGYAAVAAGTVKADGNAPLHSKLERKYSLHTTKPDNNA